MGRLARISYDQIVEGQKEFQRTDYWMLTFTRVPAGVYWLGQDLLDIRLKMVNPSIDDSPKIHTQTIRGYTVKQASKNSEFAGSLTMTLQDRDDQIIKYFLDQWRKAAGDPHKLRGLPKALYSADAVLTLYNTSDRPIRRITLWNLMPPTGDLNDEVTEDPGVEDAITATLEYEHFKRDYLNIGSNRDRSLLGTVQNLF